MALRNGSSTYICRACNAELGAIRRTYAGVREFVVAVGVPARYREGGVLELTCPCGRTAPLDWRQDQNRT